MHQALDRVVVEIEMGDFDRALKRIGIDGEAVVLRSDFYFSRGQVHHRLIAAVMAEFQFIGLAAQGQTQNLMAEANSKDRFFADQLTDVLSLA